jgi:hypothetical protein
MNHPSNPAPELTDTELPETIPSSSSSSMSSQSTTLSSSLSTHHESASTSLLILEANLSSKRRRRLPSHLIHDYGVYRDDQTDPVFISHLPHVQTSLYHPSSATVASPKPGKKRKSLPNQIPPPTPPPPAAAPPSPDESFSHLPRELRELYKTSNGFLDLTLHRRQRRENIKIKKSVDTTVTESLASLQICPQQLSGVRWEAPKKRVYKFQRIESDGDGVTSPSPSPTGRWEEEMTTVGCESRKSI